MTVGGPVQQSQLDDAGASAIARRRRAPNAATTQRFVLLVALFLVSSFFMMSTIWAAVAQPRDMAQSCAIGAGHALQATSAQNYLVTNTPAFYACLARFDDLGRIFGFGYYLATIAPLALVLLTYLLQPWWKRTFTRALWITEAQFPKAVGSELRGLAAVSGLTPGRQVSFVVDATSASTDAVVFGRPGRYTVVLKGGMCAQLRENPGAFKATVLHELAHIRNKDVDIAYLTLAVWRVFLVAVLIPFTAVNIWWLAQGAVSGGGLASALSGTWPDLLRGLILSSGLMRAYRFRPGSERASGSAPGILQGSCWWARCSAGGCSLPPGCSCFCCLSWYPWLCCGGRRDARGCGLIFRPGVAAWPPSRRSRFARWPFPGGTRLGRAGQWSS